MDMFDESDFIKTEVIIIVCTILLLIAIGVKYVATV